MLHVIKTCIFCKNNKGIVFFPYVKNKARWGKSIYLFNCNQSSSSYEQDRFLECVIDVQGLSKIFMRLSIVADLLNILFKQVKRKNENAKYERKFYVWD